ncbi:MAG: endonuclease III [Zetaproteobacteria bacterium]|nr:endonuclease III [Zetaproteobacteria bacterium]
MSKLDVERLFQHLQQQNPHPVTELNYETPFQLMVAVMLSAQSTDVGVNKVTARLFPVANTPAAIYALGEEGVKPYLATLGLYHNKAKHLIAACRMILEQFDGELPSTREALEQLPGVGRKTANVLLNILFGELVIAVDTHIFRVSNRTGLAVGKTVLDVEKRLMRRVPKAYFQHAHHWLILHGRYVCKARKPLCAECVIYDACHWREKTI